MIVITGAPRCGTSSVFNMCRNFVGEYVGDKWIPEEHGPKELNPEGYWELPIEEVMTGIHDDRYFGKLIKLHGMFLEKTDLRYVQKVIVCKRDRRFAIPSTERLLISMGCEKKHAFWIAIRSYYMHMAGADRFLEKWAGPVLRLTMGKAPRQKLNDKMSVKLGEFLWHTPQRSPQSLELSQPE